MQLTGERVRLRPITPWERMLFYTWATTSSSTKYWYGELYGHKIPTYEEFLSDWKDYYFDGTQPENGRCYVIEVNGKPIGQVNYNKINRKTNSVEVDIIIADEADKGRGYGSDALKTLSKFLFHRMSIKKCEIEVVTNNPVAIKAYQKAGFKIVNSYIRKGIEWNHMELAIV